MVIALYIAFITYSVPLCLVCATVPRTYTNEWAVKLSGGRDSADEIASKHGFENRGLVRPLFACVCAPVRFCSFVHRGSTGGRIK